MRKIADILTLAETLRANRATIKLTDMEQTILPNKQYGRTARHDSQRNEVLFFTHPHFLFFNFVAAAHCTHLSLLAYAQPDPKAKPKECNCQRSIKCNKLILK